MSTQYGYKCKTISIYYIAPSTLRGATVEFTTLHVTIGIVEYIIFEVIYIYITYCVPCNLQYYLTTYKTWKYHEMLLQVVLENCKNACVPNENCQDGIVIVLLYSRNS